MNNDLISREALKIEIEKQIAYCDDKSKHQSDMKEVLRYSNTSYGLRLAHNYIDNAPTVEPNESELVKAYTKGFDTGVETVKNERPQDKDDVSCQYCKYDDKASTEYPCTICKNNHPNMFEWKEDKK